MKYEIKDLRADQLRWKGYGAYNWRNAEFSLTPKGVRNRRAKLTDDQVRQIRKLRSEGVTLSKLGKGFGVSEQCIYFILSGKTYKNVE